MGIRHYHLAWDKVGTQGRFFLGGLFLNHNRKLVRENSSPHTHTPFTGSRPSLIPLHSGRASGATALRKLSITQSGKSLGCGSGWRGLVGGEAHTFFRTPLPKLWANWELIVSQENRNLSPQRTGEFTELAPGHQDHLGQPNWLHSSANHLMRLQENQMRTSFPPRALESTRHLAQCRAECRREEGPLEMRGFNSKCQRLMASRHKRLSKKEGEQTQRGQQIMQRAGQEPILSRLEQNSHRVLWAGSSEASQAKAAQHMPPAFPWPSTCITMASVLSQQ